MKRSTRAALLLCSAVPVSHPAFAQDASAGARLEAVTITGTRQAYQGDFNRLETPQAEQTIDAETLRAGGVFVCAALPLVVAAGVSGTAAPTLLAACALLFVYLLFWTVVCVAVAAWQQTGEVILATLVALWILLGVVVPAAGRMAIDRAVPVPSGADIIMTQREAVNDAWDLPKATTMTAFVERHPQWAAYTAVERPFEWKWYYAFQQVGDQKAQALSQAYTAGRMRRDSLAGWLAFIAPPVLLERSLQSLARTDMRASLVYEARVRDFHAALRAFYYPKLFRDERFEPAAFYDLPHFTTLSTADSRIQ